MRFVQLLLLAPFSGLFWLITTIRNYLFDKAYKSSHAYQLPIISVGNITVGGTGKTPHTEYLVRLLNPHYRLATLSRGYGRTTKGFYEVHTHSTTTEVGDEPKQLKNKFNDITVVVDEKRVRGVEILLKSENPPQIIILDDAFQHRHIKPGFSMVLVDYNRPIFNDYLLPAGRLRESAKNINRADIVIVSKCPKNISEAQKNRFRHQLNMKPHNIFFTKIAYQQPQSVFSEKKLELHRHLNVILLTGIAKSQHLKQFLAKNCTILHHLEYPDHYHFKFKDMLIVEKLMQNFVEQNPLIITTEKDAMRLKTVVNEQKLKEKLYFVPIEIEFTDKNQQQIFNKKIYNYVTAI